MEISIRWSMCRVCTTDHNSDLHNLYSPDNVSAVLYLRVYAGIEVKSTDGLPDKICTDCLNKLELVHEFLDKCKQSNEYLKNLVLCTMSPSLFYQGTNKKEEQETVENPGGNLPSCLFETKGEDKTHADAGRGLFIDRKDQAQEQAKMENQCTDEDSISNGYTTYDLLTVAEEDTKEERQSLDDNSNSNDNFNSDFVEETKVERQSQEEYDDSSNDDTTNLQNLVPEAVTLPPDIVDLGEACEPSIYQFQFNCTTCGNWFQNENQLLVHMRSHRKEKSYECELCSKRFNAASNLTTHMRTHTGEKPFGCTFCGRTFADRSTLRKHERTHTKERPYSCSICSKTFSLSTSLKAHFLSHSGEKPHKCLTCNKGFRLPHQLKAHQKSHAHKQELGLLDEEDDISSL